MQGGDVRLVEILAALSLGTDLGMGQPLGHAMRCCLLATGLADALGLSRAERADVFYTSLLRYVGCTSDSAEVAEFAGNEIALAAAVAPHVMGTNEQERAALGSLGDAAGLQRAKNAAMRAHCEAASLLSARLGLGDGVVAALRHGFERWDGAGFPDGLDGPEIPMPTRIAVVARDVELWWRAGGGNAVREVLRVRRGRAYDPAVVDAVLDLGDRLLAEVSDIGWDERCPTSGGMI